MVYFILKFENFSDHGEYFNYYSNLFCTNSYIVSAQILSFHADFYILYNNWSTKICKTY